MRITYGVEYLGHLIELYQRSLSQSLRLKPGAAEVLQSSKGLHKKSGVVAEGLEDAQFWTVK